MAKLWQPSARSSKIETLKQSKLLTNTQSNTPQFLVFPIGQKQHAAGGIQLVMCGARLVVFLPGAACLEELREVADKDLKEHAALDLKTEQQKFQSNTPRNFFCC